MLTHRETNDSDGFEDLRPENGEHVVSGTSQPGFHARTFNDYRQNDDKHRQNS